jgi:RNA polymerase sigma factor (sigma-70 family)
MQETLDKRTMSIDMSRLLDELYESNFYVVARYVSRKGGSLDDAKDVFHDALVALYVKLEEGREIDSYPAYLVGIAKNLWRRRLGTERHSSLENVDEFNDHHDETLINESMLLQSLKLVGEKCLQLLSSFYFERMSIPNLIARFGFKNEHSASVQKYKCIEKLREELKSKSVSYEDFFE